MDAIRQPVFAGTFYPDDPSVLATTVKHCLPETTAPPDWPRAIIAPHAGYIYSGSVAGRAYAQLSAGRDEIRQVILLGPSHRVAFRGMAVPTATAFRTPLGDIAIDAAAIQAIIDLPGVGFADEAHQEEHSLEVHLPFLQTLLSDFTLVPIVVGEASKEAVARVISRLVDRGDATLVVISSDLSHYQQYEQARQLDQQTSQKIVALDATLSGEEACGCRPVNGLLHYLALNQLTIEEIEVKNSGDTAGPKDRVVGYGAWRVMPPDSGQALQDDTQQQREDQPVWPLALRQQMLQLAREAIRRDLEGDTPFNPDLQIFPASLQQRGACFVTLNLRGALRGCIGSLAAHRPLVEDITSNARAAAFHDPRFQPLTPEEYENLEIHLSILSPPTPMKVASRAELLAAIRPGVDGLVIKEHGRQATYLPSVWQQLPDPEQFVFELRRKAGLAGDGWSEETEVLRYGTEEFS